MEQRFILPNCPFLKPNQIRFLSSRPPSLLLRLHRYYCASIATTSSLICGNRSSVDSSILPAMDRNHLIVVVKVLRAYVNLLIVLSNVANWLIEYEQIHHERRNLRQRAFTRFQSRSTEIQRITCAADAIEHINLESEVGAETEEFTVPLSNPSNVASTSPIPHEGEASSRKRKRKSNVAEDVIKMIEKGLNTVSEEMSKLVSVVGTPGLGTMPAELKKMGFDASQCVAIGMYFADNPIQLRLWNDMDDEFKPTFVTTVLQKLGM